MKSILTKVNFFWGVGVLLFTAYYCQTVTAQNKNMFIPPVDSVFPLITDTSFVWHPEAIYVILPDMKLEFDLPYEKDQSGVANLLFQDKLSGEIYLLDTIKIRYRTNARFYTLFPPARYDAILLYNNGKYIRYNDVVFEKGVNTVVDMEKLSMQQTDSESRHWLGLRRFLTSIGTRQLTKDECAYSEKKVRGYIFFEDGSVGSALVSRLGEKTGIPMKGDGYFEIDADNYQTLEIICYAAETQYINIKSNSGLILVTKMAEEYKHLDTIHVTSGPCPVLKNDIK